MAQPWQVLDRAETEEGMLELRQRGKGDYLITVSGRVLMNSLANRSEVVLGELGCRHLKQQGTSRVLVGGLGMGCTLRAVLDSLPEAAEVIVAELNPVVVGWCRGPLSELTDGAVVDPRVTVETTDVAQLISQQQSSGKTFDAVIFDLYEGPHYRTDKRDDPLYGSRAIARVKSILNPGGVFAVWGENFDEGFDRRLKQAGFKVRTERPGRGGLRHVVFLAEKQ